MRLKFSLASLSLRRVKSAVPALSLVFAACAEDGSRLSTQEHASPFHNPLVAQRSDPWVHKTTDGRFYFTATVPEFNRIEIRTAESLSGLKEAEPKVIWRKHWRGPMSAHIWSPELHLMNGIWYVYFSAGSVERPWDIRLYVLSNTSENPMQGEWKEEGRLRTAHDTYALDATTFEYAGQHYLLWSQKDANDEQYTSLYISAMASPTELTGPEVLIAEPEYPWEMKGIPANLGPSVLVKNGRVFVAYSAGATDQSSAIGLLWADASTDLLNPSSWKKLPEPVLATSGNLKRYGPGVGGFTVTTEGARNVLLYHARNYSGLRGNALTDPNRHTRARVVRWTENNWPVFDHSRQE